jgi:hypothetical protein
MSRIRGTANSTNNTSDGNGNGNDNGIVASYSGQ